MKKYGKYIIALLILIAAAISVCFVPIGISKFIPVIEKEVSNELGVKVHIEKLVLRGGAHIRVKAPIVHVMYEDGQKFAQFNNVKFYISWSSILKKAPVITCVDAKNLVIRVNSDDKYLSPLLKRLEEIPFQETPCLHIKDYNISYQNSENNDKYTLKGQDLQTKKLVNYKNYKLSTVGNLLINDKKYIGYDISVLPRFELPRTEDIKSTIDIIEILNDVKNLDFHTDIIADLKFYNSADNILQSSGFINVDNISVLDSKNKSPKSFIYLTFLGDKVSLKSDFYASGDEKIYMEGLINTSSKPSVDMKVKTDDINLSDLYTKLKVLSGFSKFKNIKSVKGVMNANFTLKGDLNKIRSNGYMKITNADIISNSFKINQINADIDFSNNVINVVNALGYVNNAPIMLKGTVDKNLNLELLMNKVELKYLLPENLGVKTGIVSLAANLTGTIDNVIHKENLNIDNLKIQNNDAEFYLESLKFDTNKNNTAYINNILINNKYFEQIKIPSLKLQVEPEKIKLPETNVFMPNSKLSIKSEVLNYNNNDITFNTILTGFVHSKDIKNLNIFATRYPLLINLNGNKSVQNINSQILLEQTNVLDEPALLNMVAKLEKGNLKLEDLSINSFTGNFSNDYKANQKGAKKAVLTGQIENIKKPVFKNFRIFIPQQLNLHIADTLAQLKGDIFLNGEVVKPEIVGQITLSNLFNQGTQLSLSNAIIDFNKNTASLNAPLLKIADSSMGVTATFETDFSNAINIRNAAIKAKYINTDTLLMYKDSPMMKLLPVKVHDGKFYAERLTADLYGSSVFLSQLNSDIKLFDNILVLKNIAAEAYNGKIAGVVDFNLKDETFKTKVMARGVSASPIFDVISVRDDAISGTMDFDTSLSGVLTSKSTLNGDIKFIVHNGRMSSLGKLEHLLYAQNVIADSMLRTSLSVVSKAVSLKDTGLFKYLRGDITLHNGVANINLLQSQGPLMSLYIKGLYYPDTNIGKLTVLGRLSDEVVSGLGAFGDFSLNKLMVMLTGEDNKYNILPEDFDKIPQLPMKNTKEFRSVINGNIDKPSSVMLFNWISYSQKSYRQKDIPNSNTKVPSFVDEMPY